MSESRTRWTLSDAIRFYERHGHMGPYGIRGGENEAGNDDAGSDDGAGGAKDADDAAGLKTALQKERDRAKTAERELKKLQTRLDELDGKDKSDVERLTKERDTLADTLKERETRLREQAGRTAVYEAAREANATSSRAVYALIRDDIEFDDDGEPTNIDALIVKAKKDEPVLFRAAAGSGDGGKGGNNKPDVEPGMGRLAYAYEKGQKTKR